VATNATGFKNRLDFRLEIDLMTGGRRQGLDLLRRQAALRTGRGSQKNGQDKFQSGFQHSKQLPIFRRKSITFLSSEKALWRWQAGQSIAKAAGKMNLAAAAKRGA
jgi:hypothetical protein